MRTFQFQSRLCPTLDPRLCSPLFDYFSQLSHRTTVLTPSKLLSPIFVTYAVSQITNLCRIFSSDEPFKHNFSKSRFTYTRLNDRIKKLGCIKRVLKFFTLQNNDLKKDIFFIIMYSTNPFIRFCAPFNNFLFKPYFTLSKNTVVYILFGGGRMRVKKVQKRK